MANIYQQPDKSEPIDIIVLGAFNVGKTTLVQKFCNGTTPHNTFHTIGIQFTAKNFIHKGTSYRIKFWDTSGAEKYKSTAIEYFKQASAALIVYDVTSFDSFHQAKGWINQLADRELDLPIILFGNKRDMTFEKSFLKGNNRQVQEKQAKQFADSLDGIFMQGCGKTDNNLQLAIGAMIDKFFNDEERIQMEQHEIISKCFCC